MKQLAVLGLVLAGSILLFVVFAFLGLHDARWPFIPEAAFGLIAAGLFYAAYRLDRARVRQADDRQRHQEQLAAKTANQTSDAMLESWQANQVLKVRPIVWSVPIAIFAILFGGCMTFAGALSPLKDALVLLGIGGCALASGLWIVVRTLPALGQPAMELSATGVTVPLYGHLPWRDVTGICVRFGTSKDGRKVNFRVLFKWIGTKRALVRPHWTDRLLGMMQRGPFATGIIATRLCPLSENPDMVEAVARRLWRNATGLDYPWHPGMTDAQMASMQRHSELLARIERKASAIQGRAADAISPDELASIERDMRELEKETAAAFDWPHAVVKRRHSA